MSNIFIHIGFPKTATTTLQSVMMAHPDCTYVGKGLRDTMEPSLSLDVASAVFFADTRRFEAHLPDLQARLAEQAQRTKCLILSDEAFTFAEHMEIGTHWQRKTVTDHDIIADRLARLCPNAAILMSTRNQFSFLQSFFRQLSKRKVIDESFDVFLDRELATLPYRSMLHLLLYDEVLNAYQTRFGANRVMVSAYEDYKDNFGRQLTAVAQFCGLNPDATLDLWGGAHANKARQHRERSSVRKLRNMTPPILKKLVPKAQRTRFNQALAMSPIETHFTPAQTQTLTTFFASSNAIVAQKTGLDLATWGYPLP